MAIRYLPAFFALLVVLFTTKTIAVTSAFIPHTVRAPYPICTSKVCCSAQCGTCGGEGCNQLPGGANMCCEGRILEKGRKCDQSHTEGCIRTPFTPFPILKDNVYCAASCGTCGGHECAHRPGGMYKCCVDKIWEQGLMCNAWRIDGCVVHSY